MSFALGGADRTRLQAGSDLRPRRRGDELGLAADDSKGRVADVGAVPAEADAPAHVRDVLLRQICIGAGSAALQAGKALIDAAGQEIAVELSRARVSLQHVLRQRHRVRQYYLISRPDDSSPG